MHGTCRPCRLGYGAVTSGGRALDRVYDARVLTPEILGRTLAEAPDPELARVAISRVGDDAVAREQLARPEVLPVAVAAPGVLDRGGRLPGPSSGGGRDPRRRPSANARRARRGAGRRHRRPRRRRRAPRRSAAARCCGSRPATSTARRSRTWWRRSRGSPRRAWRPRCQLAAGDVRMAVIGLGKLGGGELNYASDVDLIFVHADAGPEAQDAAERAATALIRSLAEPTAEGIALRVDPTLRPGGRGGLLVPQPGVDARLLRAPVGHVGATGDDQGSVRGRRPVDRLGVRGGRGAVRVPGGPGRPARSTTSAARRSGWRSTSAVAARSSPR